MDNGQKTRQQSSGEESDERPLRNRLLRIGLTPVIFIIALAFCWGLQVIIMLWAYFQVHIGGSSPLVHDVWEAANIFGVVAAAFLSLLVTAVIEVLDSVSLKLRPLGRDRPRQYAVEALLVSVAITFFALRNAGVLPHLPLTFLLVMASLLALGFLRIDGPLNRWKVYEKDATADFLRRLSPRLAVVMVVFCLAFFLGYQPFLLTVRFMFALVMMLVPLLGSFVLGFAAFFVGRTFSEYLLKQDNVHRPYEGLIAASALAEMTWSVLPILGLVPALVTLAWIVLTILHKRWPILFKPEVRSVRGSRWEWIRASFWADMTNLKVGLVCLLLIVGTSLAANEISALADDQQPLSPVRIAIVDDGINTQYSALRHHVAAAKSFVDPQWGFEEFEPDPLPGSLEATHGTKVALCVLEVFPGASLVNARVRSSTDDTTIEGTVEAIRWAVEEGGAKVINLSFGLHEYDDENARYDAIIEWAWSKGVVVVTGAGNEHGESWAQNGLGTIGHPSSSLYAITAGAVDSLDYLYPHSGRGPSPDGRMKPDVSSLGNYWGDDEHWGTSFSSPRVAGAAGLIIDELERTGIPWTPGLIRTAIVAGASATDYQEYEIGAGIINVQESLRLIYDAPPDTSGVPMMIDVLPSLVPLDFEYVFSGVNHTVRLTVVCSSAMNVTPEVSPALQGTVHIDRALVNQCGVVDLTLMPPHTTSDVYYDGHINLTAYNVSTTISVSFTAVSPRASVALDTSHDSRNWYSTYTLYSEFYEVMCRQGISITEFRTTGEFQKANLSGFDAVVVFHPFASWPWLDSRPLDNETPAKLRDFVEAGGGLLFAMGVYPRSTSRTNLTSANRMLNWTGISILNESWRSSWLDIEDHPLTQGIEGLSEMFSDANLWLRAFNTTANFTHVIRKRLVCGNASERIVAFGGPIIFENKYMDLQGNAFTQLAIAMMKWVAGIL